MIHTWNVSEMEENKAVYKNENSRNLVLVTRVILTNKNKEIGCVMFDQFANPTLHPKEDLAQK
jgi:hypothetical protein